MRIYFSLFIVILFFFACNSERTLDFQEVETKIDSLKDISRYTEAIQLLDEVRTDYLTEEYEITKQLALLYGKIGSYEKSFELWNIGHKKGYFFGLFSHFPVYEPFKKFAQFDSISKVDMDIRKDSLANSKTTYEIVLPENYTSENKYPLMIILHGGGSSIARERRYWKSEKLQNEFIVAFVQSYLYYDMKTFGWGIADERGRNDLKNCYDEIKNIYNVDTSEVIIGGVSAGGYMAMDMSISNFIPVDGFIAICPDVTADDFSLESIKKAKLSGIRGVIISGENDHTLENQKSLLEKFNEAEFNCSFEVVQGMGHEFPESFEARLYSAINYIQNNFPILAGKYLGQNKPGDTPEIFAPGIVSTSAKEFAITFSPDRMELYFTRSGGEMNLKTNTIFVSKVENNFWSEPKIASFSGEYFDFEPHITPDGSRLYFGSRRPMNGGDNSETMRQWYLERTPSGWSSPQPLGFPFNDFQVMYISVAMNRNLYFSVDTYEAGIWYSKYLEGKYQYPVKLPDQINYLTAVLHPYIAPNESYIVFDVKSEKKSSSPDLFISYRDPDNNWTKAEKLKNNINISSEMCPSVSPDGKYLFFARDGDIYWTDMNIIMN
jgi:predicted esterase